jgi:hypothetical protein
MPPKPHTLMNKFLLAIAWKNRMDEKYHLHNFSPSLPAQMLVNNLSVEY